MIYTKIKDEHRLSVIDTDTNNILIADEADTDTGLVLVEVGHDVKIRSRIVAYQHFNFDIVVTATGEVVAESKTKAV